MPGIFGTTQPDNKHIDDIVAHSYSNAYLNTHPVKTQYGPLIIKTLSEKPHCYNTKNQSITLEGYLLDYPKINSEILAQLLHQFNNMGCAFAKDLRGSFQITLIDFRGNTEHLYLISDTTASRGIFYTHVNSDLYWSPEPLSLLAVPQKHTLSKIALTQFMIGGYFPANHTAYEEIKKLGPGEYLHYSNSQITINRYFTYELHEDWTDSTKKELVSTLTKTVDKSILDCWHHSQDTGILLSGGYDSQYIFHTIAEHVNDTTKLQAITWGVAPNRKNSDISRAKEISKHFGCKHIILPKTTTDFAHEFDEMFIAESGMSSASLVHSNELTVLQELRAKHNIKSLIRGDECFGFFGISTTFQDSLNKIQMSFADKTNALDILRFADDNFRDNYNKQIKTFIPNNYSPNQAKDHLYFYHRLNMMLNSLSYFKLHLQEQYNPLLAPPVLSIISHLPSRWRDDKNIFKRAVYAKIGRRDIIASNHNMIDWESIIASNPSVNKLISTEIYKSDNSVFDVKLLKKYLSANNSEEKPRNYRKYIPKTVKEGIKLLLSLIGIHKFNHHNTPVFKKIIYAVVLNKWLTVLQKEEIFQRTIKN
jgi:asparagine synthetase B (glutamine-hydrolysing)